MNMHRDSVTRGVIAALLCAGLVTVAHAEPPEFTLANAVPNDVFLLVNARHNPEREFLDTYWKDVLDTAMESGVCDDLWALLGTLLEEGQMEEVTRLRQRATELMENLDCTALVSNEMAFAERLNPPITQGEKIVFVGPPDMVWLLRGAPGSAEKNYEALRAMLEALVEEINHFAGNEGQGLMVEQREQGGTKLARVNLLAMVTPVPTLSIAVAQHEDVVFMTLGDQMLEDVIGLLNGDGAKPALAAEKRFKAAFADLPPAEDSRVFFDLPAMMKPIHKLIDIALAKVDAPAGEHAAPVLPDGARSLVIKAAEAYEREDFAQALELTKQAHEKAPHNPLVLYNLACFSALTDQPQEAVTYLEQAVEAGFDEPDKIVSDSDLDSLRENPRYAAALAVAKEKAAVAGGSDQAKWALAVKRIAERLMDTIGVLDYTAAVEFTDGYDVRMESVAVLKDGAREQPIYAVFGSRKPLENFDKYLPKETVSFSVSGGFDLGQLYKFIEDSIRTTGPIGEQMLHEWAMFQENVDFSVEEDVLAWFDGDSVSVTLEGDLGSVSLIKVTDEAIAREKIDAAVKWASNMMTEVGAANPMLMMMAFQTSPTADERLAGFQNLHLTMLPQPMVFGVADGYLIFGSSAEGVALCLETAKGNHPGIRENARVMQEALVPPGPFVAVSLTDQRRMGQQLAEGIGMVSMGAGMLAAFIPEPEVRPVIMKLAGILSKLTPAAKKIDFYKSTAAYTTFDGDTWHTHSVTHYVSPDERTVSALRP